LKANKPATPRDCPPDRVTRAQIDYYRPVDRSLRQPLKAAFVNAALVGSGGFIGAVFRYWLSGLALRAAPLAAFPYGTLAVNMLGCLLIGAGIGLADARQLFSLEFRLFAFVGVLGGFTTYSTFGFDTFELLRETEVARAALNVTVHVVLGVVMVWAGYTLAAR